MSNIINNIESLFDNSLLNKVEPKTENNYSPLQYTPSTQKPQTINEDGLDSSISNKQDYSKPLNLSDTFDLNNSQSPIIIKTLRKKRHKTRTRKLPSSCKLMCTTKIMVCKKKQKSTKYRRSKYGKYYKSRRR